MYSRSIICLSVVTCHMDLVCFHRQDTFQLQIFAFLEPANLCRISRVCRRWYSVSCDVSLWRRRLEFDIHKWSVIGHSTNPDFYAENESDLSCKEMYVYFNGFFNTELLTALVMTFIPVWNSSPDNLTDISVTL